MNKEQIKEHWEKHKVKYLCTGTAVSSAIITLFIVRRNDSGLRCEPDSGLRCEPDIVAPSLNFRDIIGDYNTVTQNIYKGEKGHPGFLTRCIETGELFSSQKTAADHFGISESALSSHLNKDFELDQDLNFERVIVQ